MLWSVGVVEGVLAALEAVPFISDLLMGAGLGAFLVFDPLLELT